MSIELDNVSSGYNLSTINSNFQKVETYINDSLLHRKGSVSGETLMQRDLDMNGNKILNADIDGSSITNDRAIRVPAGEGAVPPLPSLEERKGKILTFDPNTGLPIVVAPQSGSAVDVLNQLISSADGEGDALVTVKQPYTGSVTRSQHSKNIELLSVNDFGADPTGVSDSTAAIQAMATATNGYVKFPKGNYRFSDIVLPDADITIRGEGRNQTVLTYTGTGTAFSATFTNSIRMVEVMDIRLLANSLAVAKGFYFQWPEDFEHGLVQRGSFQNVSIRGVNEYEQGFNVCVHMHQGDNINFINCEFKGAGGSTTVTQAYNTRCAYGVQITGRYSPVEYRFIGCYFGSFQIGIRVDDTAEGIYISDSILIACQAGVYWVTGFWSPNWPVNPGSSASGRPLLSIHNTHINYYQYGVYTSGVVSIHETDLLLYHNENSTQNGIALAHGNGTDIFINTIESWGFNTTYYTDSVVFYESVSHSKVNNVRAVAAAVNSMRYVVENRLGCNNNSFYQITRRTTGGSFVTNKAINDLSGGLVDIGTRGGLFYSTAGQSVTSGPNTVVNFGARDYDPESVWPGFGGNMVVPAGVTRIRLTAGVLFDPASTVSAREAFFLLGGGSSRGMGEQSSASVVGKGTYLNIQSGIIQVTPGDVITLNVRHDDGVNRNLLPNQTWCQFEIIA